MMVLTILSIFYWCGSHHKDRSIITTIQTSSLKSYTIPPAFIICMYNNK